MNTTRVGCQLSSLALMDQHSVQYDEWRKGLDYLMSCMTHARNLRDGYSWVLHDSLFCILVDVYNVTAASSACRLFQIKHLSLPVNFSRLFVLHTAYSNCYCTTVTFTPFDTFLEFRSKFIQIATGLSFFLEGLV